MLTRQAKKLELEVKKRLSGEDDLEKTERAFFAALLLTRTIKRLLATNLLDKKGCATIDSENVIKHGEAMSEQRNYEEGLVATAMVTGAKLVAPTQVRDWKAGGVIPGAYSEIYFWQTVGPDIKKALKIVALIIIGIVTFPYSILVLAACLVWWYYKRQSFRN